MIIFAAPTAVDISIKPKKEDVAGLLVMVRAGNPQEERSYSRSVAWCSLVQKPKKQRSNAQRATTFSSTSDFLSPAGPLHYRRLRKVAREARESNESIIEASNHHLVDDDYCFAYYVGLY